MELESRVTKLERETRYWRMAALGLFALLCCVIFLGTSADQQSEHLKVTSVEAQRFVLTDMAGNLQAELGFTAESNDWLGCYIAAEHYSPSSLSGPGLIIYGKDKAPKAVLKATADGDARLTICDSRGKGRLDLGVFEDGHPHLNLNGSDGMPNIGMDLDADSAFFGLYDPRQKGTVPKVLIEAGRGIKPSFSPMMIFDKGEQVAWRAP